MREVIMHRIYKILLIALLMPTLILAGDLFFSEYIEGSSNNRAIEIINGTGENVDLSEYSINQSYNGTGWGTAGSPYDLPLSGTLENGEVYVICASSAVADIKNVSDLEIVYGEGVGQKVIFYTGNDAIGLFKNGVLIDVIGVPTDVLTSTTGWSVAGVTNGTLDHTLIRKPAIRQGNTNWTNSAGTNSSDSEWIVYPKDSFNNLGEHIISIGNSKPLVNAGIDQFVAVSSLVTLDGSASIDPDGDIVAYLWFQISGPSVTITTPTQVTTQFTAPNTESILSFGLTVTDDSSATSTDTVIVNVVDDSPSPIIISEYVEGSSYNKYIEIFNTSDESIDLIANGYDLRKNLDGDGDFKTVFNSWDTFSQLPSGGTIVLGNSQATPYSNVDITNNTVINFNGNDAVGLFRNGLLVDVVGDPYSAENIIIDKTLRRKSTVVFGNPTFDVGEWDEYEKDNVDNLGSHSSNPNAPVITDISYEPEFVTSADEITVSATITAVEGEIDSARIFFGASGSLINEAEMWNEEGDTWMGLIPSGQTGNSIIQFYIYVADNASNTGQSASQSVIIANSTPETIANIHTNISTLDGQMVTIQGIVTIGAKVIRDDFTSAYIQDESGRGLNLYDPGKLDTNITRGDELMVVGYVEKYYTTIEVTDFIYKKISSGNELPVAQSVSVAGANSSSWEGTLIEFSGVVAKKEASGTAATNISVAVGTDTTIARIPTATGIDVAAITVGNSYKFMGVGSQYQSTYQTLIGYAEDITDLVGVKEESALKPLAFNLSPAYPNPFNPATTISWELDKNSAFEVAVFNILGQKVDVIASGHANAGRYSKVWDASKFTSGVYFVQLQAGNRVKTQKMLYLK